jgi:ABC-type phosphate/phosphonate transport system substrate-binding protein
MRGIRRLAGGILVLGLMAAPLPAAEKEAKGPLRMSISNTLFDGMTDKLIAAMMQPFSGLLKIQTGIDGELIPTGSGLQIGDSLAEDKLHLGVMEGIEFAWAREKHPDLKPLMIAVNKIPYGKSVLLVRKDGPKSLDELKGKTLGDFRYTRIFSRLYLDRRTQAIAGVPHKEFFGKRVNKDSAEEMMDDLVEGKIDAAIVEEVCLQCYQRRKPGRFKELRALEESEKFPCSVVVYKRGKLGAETRQRLHDGMIGAGKTALGRQLMTLWQMTGFESIPDSFERQCRDIVKTYPSPEKAKSAEATRAVRATPEE